VTTAATDLLVPFLQRENHPLMIELGTVAVNAIVTTDTAVAVVLDVS
jgi:hypothetical protein